MSLRPASPIASRVAFYLLATIGVGLAAAIRYQLGPVLGGTIPVVVFTLPVTLAALYGGLGPGLFATLASAALSDYLFIEPLHSFGRYTPTSGVVLACFLAVGGTISFFGQRMKALQGRLAEQAGALARVNRDLEEAGHRKDEFLAMLAHELRNPLAGISTAAELLKFVRDQQRTAQTGDIIARQVRHMTKLVDDLLDVSRVTRGLVMIEKHPVDLKEALHGAVEQVRSAIEAKRQRLSVSLPEAHACVCGDRIRLTQVISNLLGNASKYSPEGKAIRVTLRLAAEVVELEVEDEGQGIDGALLPHVFDLFVQGERSADRAQGGLGIGLALVRRIAELHEGSISADSAGRGRGSRFILVLPKLRQAAAPAVARAAGPARAQRPAALNVLVVDDNRDAADTVALLLGAHGHTVHTEYGAGAAMDRARQEQLDVVILDIGLPEMDGRVLCRKLKALAHLQDTVFVALSGYGQEKDMQLSEEAGFDRHLVKPVDIAALMGVLAAGAEGTPDTIQPGDAS